jgi:hypothetical protein
MTLISGKFSSFRARDARSSKARNISKDPVPALRSA